MLDVGIKETTTTTGTGTVALSAVPGFCRVADQYQSPDAVVYMLESGNGDREWGIGTPGASNTFARTFIAKTFVGGVVSESTPSPIALSGTSTLVVTPHVAGSATSSPRVNAAAVSATMTMQLAVNAANSTILTTPGRLYCIPFVAPSAAFRLTGMGIVVTAAAAGTAYAGVAESFVNASGAFGPGRLLGQASFDTGTTGTKTDTASFAPRLKPGHVYWLVLVASAGATIRGVPSSAMASILGLGPDAITPLTWLFANSQPTPLASDLSAVALSAATAGSTAPHVFFTT